MYARHELEKLGLELHAGKRRMDIELEWEKDEVVGQPSGGCWDGYNQSANNRPQDLANVNVN